MKKATAAKKPGAKKKVPAWAPVSVAAQRAKHQAAAKAWKPVPVAVQRARHNAAAKGTAVKGKATKAKTARKLALGEGVACCAAEAVAASLRLSGRRVDDADVLALYRRTADDPDAGATILATLEAASEYGLAGVRPVRLEPAGELSPSDQPLDSLPGGLILGVDLPGSHAVLATADGWWSWGEPYDPAQWPDAVIEEAWTLTWD